MEDSIHIIGTKIDFSGDISTYMDSYRAQKLPRADTGKPKNENTKQTTPQPKTRKLLDLQTFTPLKHEIPFGLMIVPNDITGRNPLIPIGHIEMPEDDMKDEVIRTRPRVYESPQVCLDDVPDPDIRKMLVQYTYTSQSEKTNQDLWNLIGIEVTQEPETVLEHEKFLTTSSKHYSGVDFKPKSLLQFQMTPEQNRKGMHWQRDRIVGVASNASEHFWKKNKPKYGSSYNDVLNLVSKQTKEEIKQLVESDRLDVQYDKTSPGYAGFKSTMAVGADLSKKDTPRNHPLLSTYQETFSRKVDRKISKTIS